MDPDLQGRVDRHGHGKGLMTSMNYDYETIEITLSSAIDAIIMGVPQRTRARRWWVTCRTTGNIRR